MKRKSVSGLIFGFGLIVISALTALTSCEVGLGSAVDVLTPELGITYPATGTIVRGKFALSGTCSDDGKIDHITVTIRPTDDSVKAITREYPVEYIDEVNHKWLCVIDPKDSKNPLIDGNYEATIDIEDTAKHKNSKSRSFTIDNTAPVIAITRPSAIAPQDTASTDYDSYGQDFIISGHVGDACDSKYMTVTIYDMEGNKKYTTPDKIKIDSDFSVTLASYGAEVGSTEKKAYDAIYGTDKEAGTQKFLCSITGYDSAEEIPADGSAPTDASKTGNSTTFFYMYEGDLYNDVFYPYGTSNAYKILSGTFGDSEARAVGSTEKKAAQVKELLNNQTHQILKGFFSLNPRNNPSFIVSGRDPLKLDGGDFIDNSDYEVSDGSKIVVEINPGLDGTPITEDTLGLYVIECDKDGKVKSGAQKITLIPQYKDNAGQVLLDDADVIANRKSNISKSGSVYKLTSLISTKITQGLQADKSYLIGLYGCDSKKIEIKNLDTAYGFKLVPVGSAPTLKIEEPQGSLVYKKKNDKITIKGYTEVNSAIPSIKIELITKDVNDNEVANLLKEYKNAEDYIAAGGENSIRQPDATSKGRASFTYEIDTEALDLFDKTASSEYDIKITTEAGGNTADATKTIMYDVVEPNIVFLSEPKSAKYIGEDNTVESFGENNYGYINGTVKFRVSLSDSYSAVNTTAGNIPTPKVEFIQNGVAKSEFTDFKTPAGQDFELNTTALAPGLVEIKLTCADLAGNTTSKSIYRYVDQSTDIPVIQGTNTSTIAYSTKAELEAGKTAGSAKNIIVANSTYALNFIDDDGIKALKVKEIEASSSDDEAAKKTELEAKDWDTFDVSVGSSNTQFTETLSAAGKYYFFKFLVTDVNNKEIEYGPIVVLVSAQNPVLTYVSGDGYATTNTTNLAPDAKKKISTTLEIGSVSEPYTIYRQVVGVGQEPPELKQETVEDLWIKVVDDLHSTDYIDEYTPTQDPGQYDICYAVKDGNNHFSNIVRNAKVVIDNKRPEIAITEPANDNDKKGTNAIDETNYRFEGEYTEANIDTFWYKILPVNSAAPSIPSSGAWDNVNNGWKKGVSTEKDENNKTLWKFSYQFTKGTDEGTKKLYICAVDKAGNVSPITAVEFDVDMEVPQISTIIGNGAANSKENASQAITKNSEFIFKFKATDSNGNSVQNEDVNIKKDDNDLAESAYTISDPDADNYKTITISNFTDGVYEYTIKATDNVGKEKTIERTVNLDTSAPVIGITSPELKKWQQGTDAENGTQIEIRGTAIDSTGVSGVWYKFDPADEPTKPSSETNMTGWTESEGSVNWTINVTAKDGQKPKLYICAIDKNGLVSEITSATVMVDTADPEITLTAVDKIEKKGSFSLGGTVKDGNTVEVLVSVKKNGTAVTFATQPKATITGSGADKTWTYEPTLATDGTDDGTYEYTFTAKDEAGKTSLVTQKIIFDNIAPKAKHFADKSGKDLYFRIGEADNDLDELTHCSITAKDPALDFDVGGKYKYGSFGNDVSIKIRGYFEEAGSGVKTIYYAVCSESEVSTFVANPLSFCQAEQNKSKSGTFAPLSANETKRVKKNIENNNYEFVEIPSSFKTIISTNLKENQANILVLVAEDNAGNRAADTLKLDDGTNSWNDESNGTGKNYYSINIDTKKPTVTSYFSDTTLYTNGSGSITIDGIVEDEFAGLESLTVEVNEKTITSSNVTIKKADEANLKNIAKDTTISGLGPNKWYWMATIQGSEITNNNSITKGNITINVNATDKAGTGNIQKAGVAVVTIDKTAPTVTIKDPSDADTNTTGIQVNNIFTLEGIARDNNALKTDTSSEKNLKLYYTTNTTIDGITTYANSSTVPTSITTGTSTEYAKKWVELDTTAHDSNWSFDVDSTQIEPGLTQKTVHFLVAAQDQAGNTGYSKPQTVIIDQNTDRPVITIGSSVDFTKKNGNEIWVKGSTTIYGSVIDDDGIDASGFKIYRKAAGTADSTYTQATTTYSGGSWSVKLPDNGSYVLKFEVKDKGGTNGTTFTSAEITSTSTDAALLATPKIQDAPDSEDPHIFGAEKATNGSTLIPICVDTNPPALTIDAISYDKTNWNDKIDDSTFYLGGTKNQFYIKVTADDPSGLFGTSTTSGITASFTGDMKVENDTYRIASETSDFVYEKVEGENNHEFIITVKNFNKAKQKFNTTSKKYEAITDVAQQKDFSGTLTVSVTAKDKAELETTRTLGKTIDNEKPRIKISAPTMVTSTAVVTGTVEGENVTPSVYYALTKNTTQPASNSTDWRPEEYATLSYNIYFDGAPSANNTTHSPLFRTWLTDLRVEGATAEAIANGTYQTLTTVYVWIKAVDVCGNESFLSAPVAVDPQGNRPVAEITYPDNTENLKLGGTIRVMGTANDNVEAKYAWIQLDITGTRNAWDINDYNALKNATNSNYTFGTMKSNQTLSQANITTIDTSNDKTKANNISNIAIMIPVSGGSWYQNINASGELIPSGDSNTVKMWVYATDDDAGDGTSILTSYPASKSFVVDKNNPYFDQNSLKLVQYDGTGNITAEQKYVEGMSIKGVWWLTGDINDDNAGISIISVKEDEGQDVEKINKTITEVTTGDYQFTKKAVTIDTGTIYNYTMKIKVGNTTGVGRNNFRITVTEAKDSNPLSTYKDFMINYDNKAPTIEETDPDKFNISKDVKNSNGYYYLSSAAYENYDNDTGVERIAVYFTRTISGTTYIFDPMIKRTNPASKLSTGLTKDTNDNLYWGSATISSISSSTLTLSASAPSYVHVGGLAKVKGVIYRITDVSGTSVTLSSEPAATATSVSFAVANIVDNTSAESGGTVSAYKAATGYGYGYCSDYTYDDGDYILENLHKDDSKSWTWELWVNSKNISDGDVDIHYVVFDKAGNCTPGSVSGATVKNNTPKLVSVQVGLDKNQNGTIADAEKESYFPAGLEAAPDRYSQTVDTINISTLPKVTGKMLVIPEIVGGNGEMFYRWKTKTKTTWNRVDTKLMDGNDDYDDADTNEINNYLSDGKLTTNATAGIEHDVDWLITNSTENCDDFSISYEIWDSTDGKTKFSNSNKVSINITNIKLYVRDTEAPTVELTSMEPETPTSGHIDKSSDLPADIFNATNGATDKEFDEDDKVSGKIVLTGTAKDNIVLTDLYLKIQKGNSTPVKIATYDRENAKWLNGAGNGDFTKVGTLASDGYEFELSDNAFDINTGHSVNWTLTWDTKKIGGITDTAATDVNINILVHDDAKNAGHTANRSYSFDKKVDVVPYITSLKRNASKIKTNRSRKGKYQVVIGEELQITGFNLPGTTDNAIKMQNSTQYNKYNGTNTAQFKAKDGSDSNTMTFDVPKDTTGQASSSKSGYIKVVNNNVASINNFNDNTKDNNKMTSTYSGDSWNDDIYLSVWKNNEYFWFSNDPISPSMDRYKYNTTAADVRHTLYGGWATQGSRFYASYPNTTGSGSPGNAISPAKGDETGNNSENFGDPATFYDVAISGQNRYNVLIDCWQGNTRMWGRNFVINRNGSYSHNGCQGETNVVTSSSGLRYVVERMGGASHPDNADSSDGQDEMFNQFLNPRIAISQDGNAYITYYDRYAKCLKWAMTGDYDGNTPRIKYATEGIWANNEYRDDGDKSYTVKNNQNRDETYKLSAYYTNGGMVVAGYDTTEQTIHSEMDVGEWSDIAIETSETAANRKPVIVYYDTMSQSLWVATSESATYPVNTNTPVYTTDNTPTAEGNAWNRTEISDTDGVLSDLAFGEYVSLAIDGGNNLHIACKEATDGTLYYIYGARSAYGSYTFTAVCVDSNGSPGDWTDIKLTTPTASGAAAGPVISYYDATKAKSVNAVKVAVLESTTSNAAANWDTMTVPLKSAAVSNRITLALDVTDGETIGKQATTSNNSTLAIGYVSSRFDCVYLRKE